MKQLIADFKIAWAVVRRMKDIRAFYRGPIQWKSDDSKAMAAFLQSPLGRKLVRQLDHVRCRLMVSALAPKVESERAFRNGHAIGFNEFVTLFLTLSATVPPHPDQNTDDYSGSEGFSSETISDDQAQ